jgi:para-aminobenzoate synthetase component 1
VSAFPVVIPIPYRDPTVAFAPLADGLMSVLLDSALRGPQGRYSYIAHDPFQTLRCMPHPWRVTRDGAPCDGDPFTVLANELARFSCDGVGPAPFAGGAIGFFAYELGGVLERLPVPRSRPFPADMVVGFYDVLAAFDHERREGWVISTGFPASGEDRTIRAQARAKALVNALGTEPLPPPLCATSYQPRSVWTAETSRADHEARVGKILDAVRAGDIYQANLTQRFLAELPPGAAAFDIYRSLAGQSPAPFAAFINAGDMTLISASPERFVSLDAGGVVETRPIKGTRPRGKTPEEDAALAHDLSTSAKDRAENLMIVDLLRNDLSRVCAPGSIRVPELCTLTTFPGVHHLVSSITGHMRPGLGAADLLRAAFPGGSITGAPKIRAMEIIHALEPAARGPYCGTIAWMGFNGAMDSSIIIRTLVKAGRQLVAQSGGGIVADSDPAQEYEECLTKIRPLLSVLESGDRP